MATQLQRQWTWRDAGRHGPLIRVVNAGAAALGYTRKSFVPAAFEELAVKKAGLDDFGGNSYRDGLEILCRAYNADSGITGLGQFAARKMLVDTLVKRLRLINWVKCHPQIHNEPIDRPWVITGLPRSGTTLSAALLALDSRVRIPLVWEVDNPIPPPTLAGRITDPRIAEAIKHQQLLDRLVPSMKAIHPMEASYPQECEVITQLDFRSVLFLAFSIAPEYAEWYGDSDKTDAYQLHKQLWQSWQASIPTLHWGSKAPNHMQSIDQMLSVYPDARVIWSHRDPAECLPSLVSLFLTFIRTHNNKVDPRQAGKIITRLYKKGVANMMAVDAAQTDHHWCYHLHYRELMADPVATFSSAYQHFSCELEPLHAAKIRAWLTQRPINTFGVHRYDAADFGLTTSGLRDEFGDYISRYRVALTSPTP